MLVMSVMLKVALGLLVGAAVCQLLGFACPYWVSWYNHNSGLWQYCAGSCYEYSGDVEIFMMLTLFFERERERERDLSELTLYFV